jgi:hypothetical protein
LPYPSGSFAGWQTAAPREEIRLVFVFDFNGGPDGQGSLGIEADGREGLDDCWTRSYPISGGLAQRTRWISLGDFRAELSRHCPISTAEWQPDQ